MYKPFFRNSKTINAGSKTPKLYFVFFAEFNKPCKFTPNNKIKPAKSVSLEIIIAYLDIHGHIAQNINANVATQGFFNSLAQYIQLYDKIPALTTHCTIAHINMEYMSPPPNFLTISIIILTNPVYNTG